MTRTGVRERLTFGAKRAGTGKIARSGRRASSPAATYVSARDYVPADRAAASGYRVSTMGYDTQLADRVREQLADQTGVTEKAMFGGLAFLLSGNMAVGLSGGGELMVRVGPDATDDALARPHTRLFDMTGRPMKGWILVAPQGVKTRRQLAAWVQRGVKFARTLPAKG